MYISVPHRGYFLTHGKTDLEKKPEHIFCGPNEYEELCPNCNKPLLVMLTLDTTDDRLLLDDPHFKRLRLCFCWTCNIAQDPFCYQFDYHGGIRLLKHGEGGGANDFPYDNYPLYFPSQSMELTHIDYEDQSIIHRLNANAPDEHLLVKKRPDLSQPKHQIGGEPYWVGGKPSTDIICQKCRTIMPFLASIADDATEGLKFTGNPSTQTLFFLCRRCFIVAAYQQGD
jgi:hypothetical protein